MKELDKRREQPSLAFGGQALIEGVMFRSRTYMVICVRQPNNQILTHTEEIQSISKKYKLLGIPFLRGIVVMLEALYHGVRGLYFSANAVLEEKEQFTYKEFMIAVALALAMTSFFFIVPFFLTSFLNLKGIIFNIVETIVRISIFLLYLTLVASWEEFKRILQYHGAEHKVINTYEAGVKLNVENAQNFSRLHPRCGTSLLFIMVFVSILLFSLMPNLGFNARLAYRLLLIPVIGAISYELLKLSAKFKNSKITKILILPGLTVQRLMTREPDDHMIEVAVKALKKISRLNS